MNQIFTRTNGMTILLSLSLLALSATVHAQTTKDYLKVENTQENDTMKEKDCCAHMPSRFNWMFFGDFGVSSINATGGGTTQTANGLTGALAANVTYKLNTASDIHMLLSAGVEVRSLNGTYTSKDADGFTQYDNLHYYYAGIPVMFQWISTRHYTGNLHDVNYYAEAGLTVGYKVKMTDLFSDNGSRTSVDVGNNFNSMMFQPMISAGFSYTTMSNIYLLGPYAGYIANNIAKENGVKENVMSYGVRLSVCLFR